MDSVVQPSGVDAEPSGRDASSPLDAGIVGWQRVSSKLIWVELSGLIVVTLVCLAVAVLSLQLATWVGLTLIALVAVVAIARGVTVPRRIHSIGYVLREDDLVFRRGIFYSRLVAVPYGRMQLVDVNRGPVARLLGLAELRLVTAAAGSAVVVPGLSEQAAATLRDQLIERAESRRVGL